MTWSGRRLLTAALLFAALVLAGLLPSLAAAVLPAGQWCGNDGSTDWVCPTQGTVYASKHLSTHPLQPAVPVPINGRTLTTAPGSNAHLAFHEVANCTLEEASKITPWGERSDTLFTQYRGAASCISSGLSRIRVACGSSGHCPTELRADGTFLFEAYPPSEAVASQTRITRQRVLMESCEGFIEARVTTPGGVDHANGYTSPGGYVLIEILVTSKTVEMPWGMSVEEFSSVKSKSVSPSPGECTSSAVHEEEEVIRPRSA